MKRMLLALFALGLLLPGVGWCQPPTLQATWTSHGSYGLGRPWHLALDAAGNVYAADLAEHRVFAFTPAGAPLTSWDCPAMPLLDFGPQGVAVTTTGHVYVATPNAPSSSRLFSFTTGGDYLGPVGAYGPGACEMYRPFGVAVDDQEHLYVADNSKSCVEVITSTGDCVAQWGEWGEGPGQFHFPLAIAVSTTGLVYVCDDDNQRIQVFTTSGVFVRQWGSYGTGPGQFAGPWGIALDAAGNVYVADAANNRIQVFTDSGEFITQWGTAGSGPGQFNRPRGIAVAPDGTVYVSDTWNCRIRVFGSLTVPTVCTTWGRVKVLYR
jgi:DNA-binding beta-propeller fold protein YncE